jgi:hypothetical protein
VEFQNFQNPKWIKNRVKWFSQNGKLKIIFGIASLSFAVGFGLAMGLT